MCAPHFRYCFLGWRFRGLVLEHEMRVARLFSGLSFGFLCQLAFLVWRSSSFCLSSYISPVSCLLPLALKQDTALKTGPLGL